MEKLSIEGKATRYDQAIKVAKSKIKNNKDHVLYEDDIIEIFPEIKEGEDERIRKAIIDFFKYEQKVRAVTHHYGVNIERIIAYLEKQGEQKSTAKVKPKFKIGDVIKNKKTKDVVKLNGVDLQNQAYYYQGCDGAATIHSDFRISEQDDWELVEQNSEECGTNSDKKVVNIEVSDEYKKGLECGKQRVLKYPEDFGLHKNSAWSKEDENEYNHILKILNLVIEEQETKGYNNLISSVTWIKSLKDRVS